MNPRKNNYTQYGNSSVYDILLVICYSLSSLLVLVIVIFVIWYIRQKLFRERAGFTKLRNEKTKKRPTISEIKEKIRLKKITEANNFSFSNTTSSCNQINGLFPESHRDFQMSIHDEDKETADKEESEGTDKNYITTNKDIIIETNGNTFTFCQNN